MGTNFYCREKLNINSRNRLKSILKTLDICIDSNNIVEIQNNADRFIKCIPEEIHLGKRSAGWQFLWDYHNGKYFKPTLKSIKDFLKDKEIYDEYDRYFTLDQFINDELDQFLYKNETHNDGMNSEYSTQYFISDGLRFSKFENFS